MTNYKTNGTVVFSLEYKKDDICIVDTILSACSIVVTAPNTEVLCSFTSAGHASTMYLATADGILTGKVGGLHPSFGNLVGSCSASVLQKQ